MSGKPAYITGPQEEGGAHVVVGEAPRLPTPLLLSILTLPPSGTRPKMALLPRIRLLPGQVRNIGGSAPKVRTMSGKPPLIAGPEERAARSAVV